MNTFNKTILAIATGSLLSVGAQAAVNTSNTMFTQPYLGAKIGQYDPDEADNKALSYGIYGGAKFTPYFGAEAEYLATKDEDLGEDEYSKGEYDAKAYGLYATYEYPFVNTGGLYAKGRLGFAKNEINVKEEQKPKAALDGVEVEGNYSVSDTGIAGGVGLGYNVTPNASVELAYEWYPKIKDKDVDVDVSGITLGAKFKF